MKNIENSFEMFFMNEQINLLHIATAFKEIKWIISATLEEKKTVALCYQATILIAQM